MPRFIFAAIAVRFISQGCDRDHSSAVEQTSKSIESWSSALSTAAQQWSTGSAPTVYISQLAQAADEAMQKQQQTVQKLEANDPRRASLEQKLNALHTHNDELKSALAKNDRAAAGQIAWSETRIGPW
jgi:hypothetical protein